MRLPTSSGRLTSRPPSLPRRKRVPLSQEPGKTHRGLLLAQPGSHAHHEPITVLGGVRALIGQVADGVEVDKLHGLSVEGGVVSPRKLGMLLLEEKADVQGAKIKRCLLHGGEGFALYGASPTQFQFDSRHIHQFLTGFMMELGRQTLLVWKCQAAKSSCGRDDDTHSDHFPRVHYLAGPFNPVGSPPSKVGSRGECCCPFTL